MIQIINCEQNSEEWIQARAGVPTASQFATVMAVGKGGGPSLTRRTYMLKLAGERITGLPMENYTNGYMKRGHDMEDEARGLYAMTTNLDVTRVGFVKNGRKGASPDSLVGDVGMLEIKTQAPHLLIELLFKNEFPPEHVAQVQGQLWVTEREWNDLTVFYRGMPMFKRRAVRDEAYIAKLADAVQRFNDELDEIIEQVRRYGTEEVAEKNCPSAGQYSISTPGPSLPAAEPQTPAARAVKRKELAAPAAGVSEPEMIGGIAEVKTLPALENWMKGNAKGMDLMEADAQKRVWSAYYDRKDNLTPNPLSA